MRVNNRRSVDRRFAVGSSAKALPMAYRVSRAPTIGFYRRNVRLGGERGHPNPRTRIFPYNPIGYVLRSGVILCLCFLVYRISVFRRPDEHPELPPSSQRTVAASMSPMNNVIVSLRTRSVLHARPSSIIIGKGANRYTFAIATPCLVQLDAFTASLTLYL